MTGSLQHCKAIAEEGASVVDTGPAAAHMVAEESADRGAAVPLPDMSQVGKQVDDSPPDTTGTLAPLAADWVDSQGAGNTARAGVAPVEAAY